MPRYQDTIAALATPVGTAALAVIRASGPDTRRLAEELCGRTPPPRVALHVDYRDAAGTVIDDVVVTFYESPRSYTGEDALEISCHGNPFIAQKIVEDLLARGCRAAHAGEFTQRAFLNGRMDLSQAEAVMDLIHARSERALAAANEQLRGALGRHMGGLVDRLLQVLARIEAYIDFPEEDLPPEDVQWIREQIRLLSVDSERLLATSHYGAVLRDGIRTVIVGKPNVGKSSLLNRLVGHDRALVSAEPGTTRDFIEERLTIGPHCLRLIDTAGLNPSPAPLERLGMEKTRERVAEADLILLVLDSTDPEPPPEFKVSDNRTVIVLNKRDLCIGRRRFPPSAFAVSARTGDGISALCAEIVRRADALRLEIGDELIAINARHADALFMARKALDQATLGLASGLPAELVASELRAVLDAYGSITGRVDNERMLDTLFATFCIGK